jgi:hypothetical protein
MSIELAYLVLERCPLRGELFRALLIIAIDADAEDWASVSVDKMARWGRFTRARAQLMLEQLRDGGWIRRGKRPKRQLLRRRLLMLPSIPGRRPPALAGIGRTMLEQRAALRARQVAEDMRELHRPAG